MTQAAGPDWIERLRAEAEAPPRSPRVPLTWAGQRIGSVEPGAMRSLGLPRLLREAAAGWEVLGELTPALGSIAEALRANGHVRAWRNEQLAVTDELGGVLGSIERGATRALGIQTHAVHLLGFTRDGRQWTQQRAWSKPNDPGLWDTLVGGMVPAGESLEGALARETWEEAGLRFDQLQGIGHGGHVVTRRPSSEVAAGYVVERLDWFRCVVPDGVVPSNQDGEVAGFALLEEAEVTARLERGEFTVDAALLIVAAR